MSGPMVSSSAFPGCAIRGDASGRPSKAQDHGFGTVNVQRAIQGYEIWKVHVQEGGTVALESNYFPECYLRGDGAGVSGIGGTVNFQTDRTNAGSSSRNPTARRASNPRASPDASSASTQRAMINLSAAAAGSLTSARGPPAPSKSSTSSTIRRLRTRRPQTRRLRTRRRLLGLPKARRLGIILMMMTTTTTIKRTKTKKKTKKKKKIMVSKIKPLLRRDMSCPFSPISLLPKLTD